MAIFAAAHGAKMAMFAHVRRGRNGGPPTGGGTGVH